MIRALDIFLALAAVLILILPCALVAVALRLTGEGEIFFLQERIGKNGKPFKIYKFDTMLKNSPNIGSGDITTGNDPRVLPFGKFLRKTKINELPQFLNVLNGSLSIVGPRPLTPKVFALFSPEYHEILNRVPPGITGASAIAFRDEERILGESKKDYLSCYREDIVPYKTALELWYAQRRSVWLNILLIALTAWTIFRPRSVLYQRLLPGLPSKPGLLDKAA